MKKLLIIFALVLVVILLNYNLFFYHFVNSYEIDKSSTFISLNKKLDSWCDKFYFVKPELNLRFNSKNLGYYKDNNISILVNPKTFFFNPEFMEVALAHEFGHHFIKIKFRLMELSHGEEEFLADLVAISLLGKEKVTSVILEESRLRPESDRHLFTERIDLYKNLSLENINELINSNNPDSK